jgi:hypothetical protein
LPAAPANQRVWRLSNLVHVSSGAPKEVIEVHAVGHEAALIDKLSLEVIAGNPYLPASSTIRLLSAKKRHAPVVIIALTCFYFAVSKALSKSLASG